MVGAGSASSPRSMVAYGHEADEEFFKRDTLGITKNRQFDREPLHLITAKQESSLILYELNEGRILGFYSQ